MFRLALVAICVAVATSKAVKKDDWEEPSFCNTNQCPRFTVIEKTADYELREYEASTWVSTEYEANNPAVADEVGSIAFGKLFNYIDGQNANSEKIDMTAPVLTEVLPATGPNCNSRFVMSFYLPYAYQGNAPQPTSSELYIEQKDVMRVYVRSFTDFASSEDYLQNTIALADSIGDNNLIEYNTYYTAGYDAPFKWWNRHNESWLLAKSNTRPNQPQQPEIQA